MAAVMGLASADIQITLPGGAAGQAYEGFSVVARNGRARIHSRSGQLIRELTGVASVVRTSRTAWLVTFDSGESWAVDRSALGCGCGGSSGR